ncbi:Acetyl esterase/lipase [Lentzea fradiae]|uniref:Acetyl esterase/lipase n=1 Tax=Lentzea fradiae TaxID=200378 RepID=A0A1G7WEX6_9PSEU|nr:alpha/beta fold hydrolase [Lentzea fradiae]SDG70478.1 Acetyl esterase/lipase [Lentzea fradiae]
MPSNTFDQLVGLFSKSDEPVDLATERANAAAVGALYQAVPGVADEPMAELRAGSYLMTPEEPREDLVIVLVHGGGFRSGNAAVVRPLAASLAADTRARVILPEYRLAPENPCPAALTDCLEAFDHAATLAPNVVVIGESAGANLAAAVLLQRREQALAGVLLCGVFDLREERFHSGSWVEHAATEYLLKAHLGPQMRIDYLGTRPADDPLVSPVLADLRGLPPLLIQVSSAERLLDDSLHLTTAAARAGVHVELDVWPHMFHCWQIVAGFLPEGTEAANRVAAFVNRVAEGRVVDGAALSTGPSIPRPIRKDHP